MKESAWLEQKYQLKLVSFEIILVVSLGNLSVVFFWQSSLLAITVAFPILSILSRDYKAALQIRLLKGLF